MGILILHLLQSMYMYFTQGAYRLEKCLNFDWGLEKVIKTEIGLGAQLMCLDMLEIRALAMKSAWILDRRTLKDKNKALAKTIWREACWFEE